MNKIISVLLIFFGPLILFSQKIDSLIIGNGGGFTGQVTAFKISKYTIIEGSGKLTINYQLVSKIKKKVFNNISCKSIKVYNSNSGFSKPYNTYKFIEIYYQGKAIKYTWGDPNFTTPEEIENLYSYIISKINKLNIKEK